MNSSTDNQQPTLSVIIMNFNEKDNLSAFVLEARTLLEAMSVKYELLIIDDGSTDGSNEEADQLAADYENIVVVHHEVNQGLGGVYRTGFEKAQNDLVTFFPADGQFPATIFKQFYEKIGNHDLVLGYLQDSRPSLAGRILSSVERTLYRITVGKMPKFQGILMFKREVLTDINLVSQGRGWAILIEFIYRCSKSNKKIVRAQTAIRKRRSGKSKVNNFRTIAANGVQMLELAYKLRTSKKL